MPAGTALFSIFHLPLLLTFSVFFRVYFWSVKCILDGLFFPSSSSRLYIPVTFWFSNFFKGRKTFFATFTFFSSKVVRVINNISSFEETTCVCSCNFTYKLFILLSFYVHVRFVICAILSADILNYPFLFTIFYNMEL